MLVELIKPVLGFAVLAGLWFLVHSAVCRRTSQHADQDMPERAVHGCGSCGHLGSCALESDSDGRPFMQERAL